jgi:hypothetical protein
MRSNRARTAPRLVRRCQVSVLFLAALVGWGAPVQEARAAAGPEPKIRKVVIDNGLSQSVKYFVEGGSPRLQAMVRTLQWAENEVAVIEQLQQLKLETVLNERRLGAVRTIQRTGFGYPPLSPRGGYGHLGGESSLQVGLAGVLTDEATPEAALQIFRLLEQAQTDLDGELKLLSQQEHQAAQDYVDALRARVAALPRPQNKAMKEGESVRGAAVAPRVGAGPANKALAGVIPARANVNGKYGRLLRKITVPQDWETYGDFTDFGHYQATDWAGYKNIPAGYWVYVYPHWYIWGDLKK